ncbi:MAG: FkbM family methyltransferase [Smithella sp.]
MEKPQNSFLIKKIITAKNEPSGKATDVNDLRSFLKKLYPLSGGKELIRMGPKRDGGYLLPDDLAEIQACFSPGIGFSSEFEKDCAQRGMKVFLADKSVNGPVSEHKLFHFTKKYIGAASDDDFMTLDNWVDSSLPGTNVDLLLQIDIEGYEYEVFQSVSESLMRRFRIIVAEFHALDQLWNNSFFKIAECVFDKILRTHACVHIHPNNYAGVIKKEGIDIPQVMEFSFLRKDRIENSSYRRIFPNPLDYDNNPFGAPIVLPTCWYGIE